MSKRAEQVASERRRRRNDNPTGFSSKFQIANRDDETYRYHWALDEPGRVQTLLEQDWEFLDGTGHADSPDQQPNGTRLERHGMTSEAGHSIRHVAMRKLRKFDEEDTAKEQAIVDQRDAAIQRGQPVSAPGQAASQVAGAKTFSEGITITRG